MTNGSIDTAVAPARQEVDAPSLLAGACEPLTRSLFIEAGLRPGMRVLDAVERRWRRRLPGARDRRTERRGNRLRPLSCHSRLCQRACWVPRPQERQLRRGPARGSALRWRVRGGRGASRSYVPPRPDRRFTRAGPVPPARAASPSSRNSTCCPERPFLQRRSSMTYAHGCSIRSHELGSNWRWGRSSTARLRPPASLRHRCGLTGSWAAPQASLPRSWPMSRVCSCRRPSHWARSPLRKWTSTRSRNGCGPISGAPVE